LTSAEVRYLKINFDEILRKLRGYAKSKSRIPGVRAIVLTGSLAKRSYTGTSDADVLVIADRVPARVLDRYELFAGGKIPIDVEPRVYTTKEFISRAKRGDRFALESIEIGIPLHGKRFFKDLRKSLLV